MEKGNDVQLIHSILSGNDTAFSTLVQKHQKSVHTLAWRKVGDFHVAEEITQDTFLQVYKNLTQLRNPHQFSGWMYVIANRLCLKWLRKNKSVMQSLEVTPIEAIEKSAYTHHVSEQREMQATEHRQELVKKLLEHLPESERTVVTLYYLGEMTVKEIGKFLGVSIGTIKSRLHRGRKRLQAQEAELLVRETLGGIPFPAHVTERILRQVANIKPISPSVGKPLVPWVAFGTATVLVLLMLGMSNQYLARFQKPYSFEAESERTIEIVDAPIVLDIAAKPAVRNQVGQAILPGKSSGTGTHVSDTTLTSFRVEDSTKSSTSQWTQGSAPPGGHVRDIFAASDGSVYAISPTGLHKLTADATLWTRVNTDIPIGQSLMPMAEHGGTLYIVSEDEIWTSDDGGDRWNAIGSRPKGHAVGLVVIDERDTQPAMYLALRDKGVFRSINGGTQWTSLNDGLTDALISAVIAVEKTVFVGTGRGLYRLDSGVWKKLSVEPSRAIYSLTAFEHHLYVGTGPDLLGSTPIASGQTVPRSKSHSVKIFHSADLGTSWTEITYINETHTGGIPTGITVLAAGKTLLALGETQSRSTDGGRTWTKFGTDSNLLMIDNLPAVAVNDQTFYKVSRSGIFRTTDGGKSWGLFTNGIAGIRLKDLVVFNNKLYAYTGFEVYQSIDVGASWKKLLVDGEIVAEVPITIIVESEPDNARFYISFGSKLVVDGDHALYFFSPKENNLQIFRLSPDDFTLSPIQDIPAFDDEALSPEAQLEVKTAAVSNDVFYVEYGRNLFKWRLGATKWINTGLTDASQPSDDDFRKGLTLAVSGETIYVGQRDGQLFQSFDGGESWRDVTPNLPLQFTGFKEIAFIGSTVYVATDEGVLSSQTGGHWRVITDSAGTRPIIDKFAGDSIKVYGIGDTGVYHLDTQRQWKQLSSEVLGEANALAVINDKLYSAIEERGIFHIALEE